jgi:hypothetical protein
MCSLASTLVLLFHSMNSDSELHSVSKFEYKKNLTQDLPLWRLRLLYGVNASRHRIAHYVGKHGKQVVKTGADFNYFIIC